MCSLANSLTRTKPSAMPSPTLPSHSSPSAYASPSCAPPLPPPLTALRSFAGLDLPSRLPLLFRCWARLGRLCHNRSRPSLRPRSKTCRRRRDEQPCSRRQARSSTRSVFGLACECGQRLARARTWASADRVHLHQTPPNPQRSASCSTVDLGHSICLLRSPPWTTTTLLSSQKVRSPSSRKFQRSLTRRAEPTAEDTDVIAVLPPTLLCTISTHPKIELRLPANLPRPTHVQSSTP